MYNKVFHYQYLLKELTKREIANRYKGSYLGILWTFITPVAMLLVFSFVFGEIFQAKWSATTSNDMPSFSINLFIGLSIFWFFSEILSKAPSVFSSEINYIKKVIFPLEILCVVSLLNSLFHFGIYFIIILFSVVFVYGDISIWSLCLPLVLMVTFPMLLGTSLLLGSLGVYIRDIHSIMGVFISMLMFLSPVFYPLQAIPLKFQWLFLLNPLTFIIEQFRTVLLEGTSPNFTGLFLYFIVSLLVFFLGYWVFNVTKKGFADVI